MRSKFANENHGEARSSKQWNDQRTDPIAFFWRLSSQISFEPQKGNTMMKSSKTRLKDLKLSKDDDTKTQCNLLNTSPLHRGNASNKNGPARIKRRMQWEAPSKPLAVDDPLLLPEREVHAEIGINWFLDQEIPKGGYVRILTESLHWEERLGKTRIRATEGLTTCMEPHRGWTIASSSWNFLRKRWLDREQELITVIQEETKRTEEKKKLGIDHQRGQYYERCKQSPET